MFNTNYIESICNKMAGIEKKKKKILIGLSVSKAELRFESTSR